MTESDVVVQFSITSEDNPNFVFGGDQSNSTFTLAETGGVSFSLDGGGTVLEFALAGSIPGPQGPAGDAGSDPELVNQLSDDGIPDGVVDGVALDVLYANGKV